MRAIHRCIVAVTSLLLAAAPAAALEIATALDGSGWDHWAYLDRPVLEFDDHDWAIFIHSDAPEFFLPALDAMNADAGADSVEGLLTQVWERT